MKYKDIFGTLYDEKGLRLGGGSTKQFLEATEELENKFPGVREKIIEEAHYLICWFSKFPEIVFYVSLLISKSFWWAVFFLIIADVIEAFRLLTFGSNIMLAKFSKVWGYIKTPFAIILAIIFWNDSNSFLAIAIIIFLILQSWLNLLVVIITAPVRIILTKFFLLNSPAKNFNMLAMNAVISSWYKK